MDEESLGSRIRKAREEAGLSRDRLAELIGVGGKSVQRYESNAQVPRLRVMSRLGEALGLSLDGLPSPAAKRRIVTLEDVLKSQEKLEKSQSLIMARLDQISVAIKTLTDRLELRE